MRKAVPYKTTFVADQQGQGPRTPMQTPTRAFANHYGTGNTAMHALDTRGSLAVVIPVQSPHDTENGGPHRIGPHQGENGNDPTISSNTVTGGVVRGYITSNDTIRPSIMVARNLYSPSSHASNANRIGFTAQIPPHAVKPSKDIGMPPKYDRRVSGAAFTIPAPQTFPQWPTSSQWLASKLKR